MGGFRMLSFLSKTLFENDHIFTYSSLIFKEIQQDLELRVFWFLKKCLLFQNPCIMRLAKTQKIRLKSVHLQGVWSKSTYLKCFWTQFKTAYLQSPPTQTPHILRPCYRSISKKTYYKELFEVVCRCQSYRFCLEIDQKL